MTARQFREWEQYFQLEPFGDEREDVRNAGVREMVYNVAVKAKDRKPLIDFLLKIGRPLRADRKTPEQVKVEEQASMAIFISAQQNALMQVEEERRARGEEPLRIKDVT